MGDLGRSKMHSFCIEKELPYFSLMFCYVKNNLKDGYLGEF